MQGGLEGLCEFAGKYAVGDDEVGFFGQQKAEWIDVGRADGGPTLVNDGDLGVKEALLILEDTNAVFEQRSVECLRCIVEQSIFDLPLKQQSHPNAALCRTDQCVPESPPGEKIGVGDQDRCLGRVDGGKIGLFDRPTVPEVVANDKSSLLKPPRGGFDRRFLFKTVSAPGAYPGG